MIYTDQFMPIKRTLENNVGPYQTPHHASSDQVLHCLQENRNFYKHSNDKNKPDIPSIGNGPVHKLKVEESSRDKWVKLSRR